MDNLIMALFVMGKRWSNKRWLVTPRLRIVTTDWPPSTNSMSFQAEINRFSKALKCEERIHKYWHSKNTWKQRETLCDNSACRSTSIINSNKSVHFNNNVLARREFIMYFFLQGDYKYENCLKFLIESYLS